MMLSCRGNICRAAVAQMSEQRQAGVDAGPQFVERRIAMAGRNADALLGQRISSLAHPSSRSGASVTIRVRPPAASSSRFIVSTSAGRAMSAGCAPM